MLDCLRFIFKCVADFSKMLFTINLGNGLNMGLLMCIIFIFLPIVHRVICFIKQDAMEEIDDAIDERRPRETWSFTEKQFYNPGTGKGYRSYISNHTQSRSRRYRLR